MDKKKKTKKNQILLTAEQQNTLQQSLMNELETNPEFSLEPDPTGQLKMDITQKDFIRHYVNFKSIATAAELSNIPKDDAKVYFTNYNIQKEIRRINRALYHRQFSNKLICVDDLGGYLTSLLTDDNVPIADQLKTTEKLRVVELLLRLNELKAGMSDPKELLNSDIQIQIKNLSVNAIQQLLVQNNNLKEKNKVISTIDDGSLTMEEKSYLQSLPLNDLLKLVEETSGGKNENQ